MHLYLYIGSVLLACLYNNNISVECEYTLCEYDCEVTQLVMNIR